MRIISGKHRGAKLFAPADNRVRPTSDRVKESVFNILCGRVALDSANVLDLFAGSGALGLETYSRGAAKVVFVDNDKDSVALLKRNIAKLGMPEVCREIIFSGYDVALERLSGRRFDVIFIDPPYASDYASHALSIIGKKDMLADGGIIVAEHDSGKSLENEAFLCDYRKMGNTSVSFMTRRTKQ